MMVMPRLWLCERCRRWGIVFHGFLLAARAPTPTLTPFRPSLTTQGVRAYRGRPMTALALCVCLPRPARDHPRAAAQGARPRPAAGVQSVRPPRCFRSKVPPRAAVRLPGSDVRARHGRRAAARLREGARARGRHQRRRAGPTRRGRFFTGPRIGEASASPLPTCWCAWARTSTRETSAGGRPYLRARCCGGCSRMARRRMRSTTRDTRR